MTKFKALGLVQGHQAHARCLIFIRPACGERGMIEKLARGVERPCQGDELVEIFEPPSGVIGLSVAQHGATTGGVEEERESLGEEKGFIVGDVADLIGEGETGGTGLGWERRRLDGLEKRDIAERCFRFEGFHGFGAKAAARRVDDSSEGFVRLPALGGCGEPEKRQCILDFGALVKPNVADESVRDMGAHECFFEPTAHEVVAIENCHFIEAGAFCVAKLNFNGDAGGLGGGVAEGDDLDRCAKLLSGEEGFFQALLIAGNNRIGGGEDMAGGAKVFLEADLLSAREIAGKAANISDIAAAPAVDGLIIIADDEEPAMIGGEGFQPRILGQVNILVFIGEKAIEARCPTVPVVFVAMHGENGPQQEIAEIGGVGLTESLLIIGVDANGGAQIRGVDPIAVASGAGNLGISPGAGAFKARKSDLRLRRELLMRQGIAIAGRIGICAAAKNCATKRGKLREEALDCRDRAWPHAASRRRIKRIHAGAFNCGKAQSVDGRFRKD